MFPWQQNCVLQHCPSAILKYDCPGKRGNQLHYHDLMSQFDITRNSGKQTMRRGREEIIKEKNTTKERKGEEKGEKKAEDI